MKRVRLVLVGVSLMLLLCSLGSVKAEDLSLLWPVTPHEVIQPYIPDGHRAIDITSSQQPATVYATEEGKVIYAENLSGDSPDGGWMVKIHHDSVAGGQYYTWYAHLKEDSLLVSANERVYKGQPIATMDCTGECSGPHLHFVLGNGSDMVGNAIDPVPYLSGEPGESTSTPVLPNLVLDSHVIESPNPVFEDQTINFNFWIKNNGPGTLNVVEVYIQGTSPKGSWKANANPVSIYEGQRQDYNASMTIPTGDTGTWHVDKTVYIHANNHWYGVTQGSFGFPAEFTVAFDTVAPTVVSISEPHEGDVLSGQHAITVHAEDDFGVNYVDVFIYFREQGGSEMVQHHYQINSVHSGSRQNGDWRMEENLSDPAHPAAAQENAWLQAYAYDYAGNFSTSGVVHFDITVEGGGGPMPTDTPIPPTNTPVPTATSTPVPTPTSTSTPVPTATPTSTNTPTPVPTPTPTNTPMPTATLAPGPDLVVDNVVLVPDRPTVYDDIDITVLVKNVGELEAYYSRVGMFVDPAYEPQAGDSADDDESISRLDPVETDTEYFTIYDGDLAPGSHTLYMVADVEQAVTEKNEANNVYGPIDFYVIAAPTTELVSPTDGVTVDSLRPGFEWTASLDAVEYQLQIATSWTFDPDKIVLDVTTSDLSYTLTSDLVPDDRYYWQVRVGYGGDMWSDWTNDWDFETPAQSSTPVPTNTPTPQPTATATPGATPTATPTPVATSTPTPSGQVPVPILLAPEDGVMVDSLSPDLQWDEGDGFQNHVQIATDANFTNIIEEDVRLSEHYEPDNLVGNQTYYWRVETREIGEDFTGAWSEVWNFTTP